MVGILRSQSGTSEVNSWLSGKDQQSNGLDFTPLGPLMFLNLFCNTLALSLSFWLFGI